MKQKSNGKENHNPGSQVDLPANCFDTADSSELDVAALKKRETRSSKTLPNLTSSSDTKLECLRIQIRSALTQNLTTSAAKAFKLQLRLDNPELGTQEIHELWEAIAQRSCLHLI